MMTRVKWGRSCSREYGRSIIMPMRGRLFSYLVLFFLVSLASMSPTILSPNLCLGLESGEEPAVFSLDVQDVPLGEVLKRISKITGYEITIDTDYAKFSITASLKNVTLHEGLRRILGKLSKYMIINDEEKEIAIHIVDHDTKGKCAGNITGNAMAGQKKDDYMNSEVVPPDEVGGQSITQRELNSRSSVQIIVDPMDIELVPPENPGEKGVTLRDIEQRKAVGKGNVPEDTQIVPLGDP